MVMNLRNEDWKLFGAFCLFAAGVSIIAIMGHEIVHQTTQGNEVMTSNEPEPKEVFRPDSDDFNESNKTHAIAYGALVIALLDKGIISQEEYDRAFAQATAMIDQEFARKRDSHPEGNKE